MKITYLSHSIIPSRFANSVHVMKMCQAFANNGHDVTLLAKEGEQLKKDAYTYYGVKNNFHIQKFSQYKPKAFSALSYLYQIQKYLKNTTNIDLLYSRHMYCALNVRHLQVPIIFEAHDRPRHKMEIWMLNTLFQSKNFFKLICISKPLAEEYLKIFKNLPANKIQIAQDGADPIEPSHSRETSLTFSYRNDKIQVGYIGHLYPGRGVEIIIDLAKECPDMDFHIIGGLEKDILYWRNNTQSLNNLHIHGFIDPSLGDRYRSHMDVLLAPYQAKVAVGGNKGNTVEWMSPLKIFEYMAAGKAIIASDLTAIKEILHHNENALLVQHDDMNAWKSALLRLKTDETNRQNLGKNALELLKNEYTWQARAKNILPAC